MPNDDYLIQSPKGETLSTKEKERLQTALDKIGIPSKNWRFVVLPDQNWKDMTASNPLPHSTDTAFSNLQGKVTYLHQRVLQGSDDALICTLAHEQGHAKLSTTSEDRANEYKLNSMVEIKKYGRSNNAAYQDLQNRASVSQVQSMSAPIETNLIPPSLPSNVQKVVDQVRSQEAAHQAWLQSQSQTPSKYQMGQPQ